MKAKIRIALIVLLAFMCSPLTHAAMKYGEAVIKRGNVVIVRQGRMYLYTEKNNPVTIFENDTIRTLKHSALVLSNPDQNRVILGANAIMQIKKWKQKENEGSIRMLFGKFRARTAQLKKKQSLNIRTATATMGIKGSLGQGATNGDFTSISNLGGNMTLTGNTGGESDVPLGQIGFNVDGPGAGFGMEPNPVYEPSLSEDQQETTGTEQLDTENSKSVEIPPFIQAVLQKYVVDVAQIEDDSIIEDLEDGQAEPETLDVLAGIINDAQDAFQQNSPKVNVIIDIED